MGRRRLHRSLGLRSLASWLLCARLPLGTSKGESFVRYEPKKYAQGIEDDGAIGGMEGDWKRYIHLPVDKYGETIGIKDEDRQEAAARAKQVRCAVCDTLVESLVKKAKRKTEDGIMDSFEGDQVAEWTEGLDQQVDQMMQVRRGCNKHFKDELLYEGWRLESCITNDPEKEWCLSKGQKPSEKQVETFSVENEVFWYACSATVSTHGLELAGFIADKLENGEPTNTAVKAACRQVADCDGRKLKDRRERRKKKERRKRKKASKAQDL